MSLDALGSHWLHPDRTLYGRPSCSVELIYLTNATPGFDFTGLAARDSMLRSKGVKRYYRVDYAPGRVFPDMWDDGGAFNYCNGVQQVVAQFHPDGIICGNEPNLHSETNNQEMQAWWVARMVYGHTLPSDRTDCAFQFAKTADSNVRILAPAVAPWSPDTGGDTQGLVWPDGRSGGLPHESYTYDMSRSCYQACFEGHVPDIGDINFCDHMYGRVGSDGTLNGGANEPFTDVRGSMGAQFGTRWLQDAIYYHRQGQLQSGFGTDYYPPVLIGESNTLVDYNPSLNYPTGWWKNAVYYVRQFPNILGLCAFVDQDYGGMWTQTAMTAGIGREPLWNRDHDELLRIGW